MGSVAGQTVFDSRRMLPQKRSTGVRMAFEAFLVDGLGIDQMVRDGAVGVVTIRAADFSLPQGVVGLTQRLGANLLVALPAGLFLALAGEVGREILMGAVAA